MRKIQKPGGFTLIELMAVVAIISIMLTVGSVALQGMSGRGVTSTVATTEALFDEARMMAAGRGITVRVLVDADRNRPGFEETYLRRMVITYQEPNQDGQEGQGNWVLASQGYTFPDGVFFSQKYSRRTYTTGGGQGEALQKMQLTNVSNLFRGEYYYYEFNSEGICTTGLTGGGDTGASLEYKPPSFVIGAGILPKSETEPRVKSDGKRDFGGFVIWRNGSTSIFRSPDQILGTSEENVTKF